MSAGPLHLSGPLALAGLAMLSACATLPAPQLANIATTQADWTSGAGPSATPLDPEQAQGWWRYSTQDAQLAGWLDAVPTRSDAVAGARAQLALAQADLARVRAGARLQAGAQVAPFASVLDGGADQSGSKAAINLSLDPDLQGARGQRIAAAQAREQAALARLHDTLRTTRAQIASAYVEALGAQASLAAIERAIAALADAAQLARARNQAGITSGLDEAQALASLEAFRAQAPALQLARLRALRTLETLSAAPPGSLQDLRAHASGLDGLPAFDVDKALQAPARVLLTRPDLRALLHLRDAAAREAKAARADLRPNLAATLSLTGQSVDPQTLLSGTFGQALLALSATQTLLDGGARKAGVAGADARLQEAQAQFALAIRQALAQADTALAGHKLARDQVEARIAAKAAADDLKALARVRYTAGLSPFLDVLDSERAAADADRALAQARTQLALAAIEMFSAMGLGAQE